jgi:predicted ATP-grasp superfamily ATP-dependent carboligase
MYEVRGEMTMTTDEEIFEINEKERFLGNGRSTRYWTTGYILNLMALARQDEREKQEQECAEVCDDTLALAGKSQEMYEKRIAKLESKIREITASEVTCICGEKPKCTDTIVALENTIEARSKRIAELEKDIVHLRLGFVSDLEEVKKLLKACESV